MSRRIDDTPDALAEVRIDLWLWAARFYKTRSLAKQAIEGGKVLVGDAACKSSRSLRGGERLSITRGEERFEIDVLGLSDTRGPASVAQQLYREDTASIARRAAEREARRLDRAGFQPPLGKPDKRARRLIRALGDIDAL